MSFSSPATVTKRLAGFQQTAWRSGILSVQWIFWTINVTNTLSNWKCHFYFQMNWQLFSNYMNISKRWNPCMSNLSSMIALFRFCLYTYLYIHISNKSHITLGRVNSWCKPFPLDWQTSKIEKVITFTIDHISMINQFTFQQKFFTKTLQKSKEQLDGGKQSKSTKWKPWKDMKQKNTLYNKKHNQLCPVQKFVPESADKG